MDAHCRARALSTDAGDRHGTALAWHNLGLVWMDRKEYERALIAFGRARALFGDVGDWHGAAVACYATGCLEQRIPQPDRTVRALEEAAESWKVILSLVPQPRSKVVLGTWPCAGQDGRPRVTASRQPGRGLRQMSWQAVVSYRHAYAVVSAYGEDGITAIMIPLTIDGLVYASSMVLHDSARNTRPAPVLAWLLLWLGITATLAANIAHGLHHGPVGAVVAAWPAIALVGCYEMFMWLVRSTSRQHADQHGPDLDQQALTAYKESVETGKRLSERKLAKRFGRSRRWARKIIKSTETAEPN